MRDGVDYDPAPELVLFGHHFSAIAGSGPIVGPVVAGLAFGWGPALLWILIGCIFMGSVYDYSSLIASVRNQGKSLGEIARDFLGGFSYKIFLAFLMIVLFYILIVFVDLTAATFAPPVKEAETQGGIVAMASLIYIGLAVAFGLALKRSGLSAGKLSLVFVPLVCSGRFTDPDRLFHSVFAFLSFCFISSAVYIINDIRDIEKDRNHPAKRNRPIAAGRTPSPWIWWACPGALRLRAPSQAFRSSPCGWPT